MKKSVLWTHCIFSSSLSQRLLHDKSTRSQVSSNATWRAMQTNLVKQPATFVYVLVIPVRKHSNKTFLLLVSEMSPGSIVQTLDRLIRGEMFPLFHLACFLSFLLFLSNAERHWSSADSFRGGEKCNCSRVRRCSRIYWEQMKQIHAGPQNERALLLFCLFALFSLLLMWIPATPRLL